MAGTDTDTWIRAVRSSYERFSEILRPLAPTEVERPSYASEWSIADTASHLGARPRSSGCSSTPG